MITHVFMHGWSTSIYNYIRSMLINHCNPAISVSIDYSISPHEIFVSKYLQAICKYMEFNGATWRQYIISLIQHTTAHTKGICILLEILKPSTFSDVMYYNWVCVAWEIALICKLIIFLGVFSVLKRGK